MKKLQVLSYSILGTILLTAGGFSGGCNAQKSTTTIIGLQVIPPSTPLEIPVLIEPEAGSLQTGVTIFGRTNSETHTGTTTYTWMINKERTFSSTGQTQETSNTEILFDTTTLPKGKRYWKIRANNEGGSGHFSNTTSRFCATSCGEENTGGNTSNGGGGGGGGSIITSDTTPENTKNLKVIQEETIEKQAPIITAEDAKNYSTEQISAYQYAYSKGITTMPNISKANLNGHLIRKDMAKMISEYAMKVLNKKPDNTLSCTFTDNENTDAETKYYTKLACKLGLMGREANGKDISQKFNPLQEVNRAQFGTIFSRLLYGKTYNLETGEKKNWYEKHVYALNKDNIMKSIKNPLLTKELRGWVMIMMMRADKSNNK